MSAIAVSAGVAPSSTSISEFVDSLRMGIPRRQRRSSVAVGEPMLTADTSSASVYASKFDLRRFAEMRLAALVAGGACEETAESRRRLTQVLSVFLEDGGPTPQVGSTPTKAVEIQWLCDGSLISAIVEQDGYLSVLAEGNGNYGAFEHEIDCGDEIPDSVITDTRTLLRSMSQSVRRRPFDWPSAR